jgi:hypothetical protein
MGASRPSSRGRGPAPSPRRGRGGFLCDGAAGREIDPNALAETVDRLGPFVALAEQVARGGAFAMRRASELAARIIELGKCDDDAQDEREAAQ